MPSAPVKQDGRSFAPADALAEGLEVTLTKAGKIITLTGPDTSVQLTVGEPMIKINNQEQKIDAAPFTAGGVDFLPIRRVAEAFGAEVSWDAEKQQVSIGLVK
ncbi:Copper amine oxidase N-terminal domain-containing protein [Desulfoscipio geothermicus DSM 3669]|uniref:Copper amine oxidase N-terminal domain-containing protein n=1 Tax=Desulfoscipio geothermicus DSM 3669 TaxID=1121426 RepID=A0A1I6DD73_9FIRM|nr:copper amine oxidase N-terminal domain-containing protein [Desulfoscipio geothermicus]SFR03430.1 Copper amine oxidase N-terminal domain-containing protein [Desulfoscipio geothermicus DSM 3669]